MLEGVPAPGPRHQGGQHHGAATKGRGREGAAVRRSDDGLRADGVQSFVYERAYLVEVHDEVIEIQLASATDRADDPAVQSIIDHVEIKR